MTINERSIWTSDVHRGHRPRRGTLALSSLGAVALVAVLGASSMGTASAATPTVQIETNATFGTVLAAGSGLALYTLTTDHNGQSTCRSSCAAVWPPLNVPVGTTPTVGPGVTGTVGTALQANGTLQVTYNGSPVYTFVGDSAAGQVTGNGVSDFFVVKVAAVATTTTTPAAPPPTPTSPASAGTGGTTSAPSSTSTAAPSVAASGGSSTDATSASPGSLAFTGAGPGLTPLLLLGFLLVTTGAFLVVAPLRRRWIRTP
jgi:predicted lipoprotein with Yx(FWY)xxD motif